MDQIIIVESGEVVIRNNEQFNYFFDNIDEFLEITSLSIVSSRINIITKYEIPSNISKLTNLHSLRLVRLSITNLPDSICELNGLQYLIIDSCDLNVLPENLGNLTQLVYLELVQNQFNLLPDLSGLTNLQVLKVEGFKDWVSNALTEAEKLGLTYINPTNSYMRLSEELSNIVNSLKKSTTVNSGRYGI